MNVLVDANDTNAPPPAMSLAAMIAEQPEVTAAGAGVGYSCLTASGTFIVTPHAGSPSTTPELDLALDAIVERWVRDMTGIGVTPLGMFMNFEKAPATKAELSLADATALFEALAVPVRAAGLDPTWPTYVLSFTRPRRGAPIEVAAVGTTLGCDEPTGNRLVGAVEAWLKPRRSFFDSIQRVYLEVNVSCWEVPGGPLGSREAADLDLLGLPAAGTA